MARRGADEAPEYPPLKQKTKTRGSWFFCLFRSFFIVFHIKNRNKHACGNHKKSADYRCPSAVLTEKGYAGKHTGYRLEGAEYRGTLATDEPCTVLEEYYCAYVANKREEDAKYPSLCRCGKTELTAENTDSKSYDGAKYRPVKVKHKARYLLMLEARKTDYVYSVGDTRRQCKHTADKPDFCPRSVEHTNTRKTYGKAYKIGKLESALQKNKAEYHNKGGINEVKYRCDPRVDIVIRGVEKYGRNTTSHHGYPGDRREGAGGDLQLASAYLCGYSEHWDRHKISDKNKTEGIDSFVIDKPCHKRHKTVYYRAGDNQNIS